MFRTEEEKEKERERANHLAGIGIAHFGKALMQSRLRSARVLLGAFNDSSSTSSSPSFMVVVFVSAAV